MLIGIVYKHPKVSFTSFQNKLCDIMFLCYTLQLYEIKALAWLGTKAYRLSHQAHCSKRARCISLKLIASVERTNGRVV